MKLFLIYPSIGCFLAFISNYGGLALDNGLAKLPPMGWLSWVAFGCQVDCKEHPLKCVSQQQIVAMADQMIQDGYQDAGYEYVIIDDCWLAPTRDAKGRLQPDAQRFSKGIKWLADYIHTKTLKFGIYEDYGTKTCAGYPGSIGQADLDAQTFADWGVDYLKLDGCNVNASDLNYGYPAFRKALNKTGRSIVYSCEWPLYTQMYEHKMPNYTAVKENCNLWRNSDDCGSTWEDVLRTIDYFDKNQDALIAASGPGGWNDPDMLGIGNPGLSEDQAKVQMALWSIWSAPLLMSVDLRFIAEPFKKILLNRNVIAVDQDPLGIMGRLVIKTPTVNVYVKVMNPVETTSGDYSYAIAFFNRDTCRKANVTIRRLEQLGLRHANGYLWEDLFENKVVVTVGPKDSFSTVINPTGVTMFKATIIKK